jgi:protein SCO1/2
LFVALATYVCPPGSATAQLNEDVPKELEGVGITPRLDAAVPLDATFRDETGAAVSLGHFFGREKPVVLNFVYFDCPMLCNVFLDGFVSSLRNLAWVPGDQFEIVTISMNPLEKPEEATIKRDHFLDVLGHPEATDGWHFLTGNEADIRRVADAVGFSYRYDEKKKEYMHSAGLFLVTPGGRLSRFLSGVNFDPQTLRLSLVETSDGKIGSAADQFLLYCFAYDHAEGRYGPAAFKIMRVFAALTVLIVGAFLAMNWKRESRRKNDVSLGVQS